MEGSLQTGQVWLRSVGFPRGQDDASSWRNAQVDRIRIDDNSSQTLSSMITLIFKQNSLQTVSICYFVVLSDLEQNQQLQFSLFSPLSHDVMHRVSAAALLLCMLDLGSDPAQCELVLGSLCSDSSSVQSPQPAECGGCSGTGRVSGRACSSGAGC